MNLIEIRNASKMDKSQFAKSLGMSLPTLRKYENGDLDVSNIDYKIKQFIKDNNLESLGLHYETMSKEDIHKTISYARSLSVMANDLIDLLGKFI
jgi:transcriptional regulator with XRE-family HTH domain